MAALQKEASEWTRRAEEAVVSIQDITVNYFKETVTALTGETKTHCTKINVIFILCKHICTHLQYQVAYLGCWGFSGRISVMSASLVDRGSHEGCTCPVPEQYVGCRHVQSSGLRGLGK